jgi:hypothetical protein
MPTEKKTIPCQLEKPSLMGNNVKRVSMNLSVRRGTLLAGYAAMIAAALLFTGSAAVAAAKGGNKGPDHSALQDRPMMLGVSGSGIEFLDVDGASYCYAGTLGSLVQDSSNSEVRFILSNNHVLARENQATKEDGQGNPGEAIIQPGLLDENGDSNSCSPSGTDYTPYLVGDLADYVALHFDGSDNLVDAAIAAVATGCGTSTGDCVDPDGQILEIGGLSGDTFDVDDPESNPYIAVQKSGRTTGLTTGAIGAVGVDVSVTYDSGTAHFTDQILVSGDKGAFLKAGDSGSLLVTRPTDGSLPDAVGLLFAGTTSGIAIANRIQNVLEQFGVTMVACSTCSTNTSTGGGGGHGGGGNGGGGGGHGKPTVDARGLDIAKAVRDQHRTDLMANPDVVGTGIGVDENGQPVIQVYTRGVARRDGHPIPSELGGIQVHVVVTGEFHAY